MTPEAPAVDATAPDPAIVFPAADGDPVDDALLRIGRMLQRQGYRFTTVTPDTHAVVAARGGDAAPGDLRAILGWNRPFLPAALSAPMLAALETAQALTRLPGGRLRARVRYSTIGDLVVLHSGFPTSAQDAVFFGPDTYRFVHLLRRVLPGGGPLLELGAGSGAAALALADRYETLVLTDINPLAVRYARINAALAGCDRVYLRCADLADRLTGRFDAIIANPPYLADPERRWYRDGGDLGIAVALRMVEAALPRLAPGGTLVLYTGAPIVDGRDILAERLLPLLRPAALPVRYEELDVDVFGSELASPAYAGVERIAVVAMVAGATAARTA